MRFVARPILLCAVLAGCAGNRAAPAADGATPISLTIVATNDLHGWVQPHESRLDDGRVVKSGGLAVFASYLARLREENPGGVVLLDGGDLFQGTLVANLSEGAVVVDAYNALGYDASSVGNHEFDYGPVGPKSAAVDPGDDPCGALAARAAQAHFPMLARNVYLADGTRPAFFNNDGTFLVERKGVKVGVVGLLTPQTPQVTNPVNVSKLRFGPLAEEARSAAQELRAQGATVLVAAVHAGGRCASFRDPSETASCDMHGEIFELLETLPFGLFDAVVAAHTHTRLAHIVNGMPVIQSGAFGTQFGWFAVQVDPRTRKVQRQTTQVVSGVPICERFFVGTSDCDLRKETPGELVPAVFHGKPVVADPEIDKLIQPHLAKVAEEQKRSLHVRVSSPLTRNYSGESLLGDALADAVRAMEATDVALLNAGGLRSDLPEGELSFGQLYEVFPFDNTIATLTVTGGEVAELLETLLGSGHGAPQISGLRIRVSPCGRPHLTEVALADGRPFDRKATYKLTTSDFLALGGDGVGRVVDKIPAARKDLGHRRAQNMRDALAVFLEKKGGALQSKLDGRLVFETGACPKVP
jgi:5'-nucleotidase